MTPKLFRALEVCELAQLQPYVLRSWEKEFPGIGVQKSPDAPRLYRQSDLDQVLRIKQLVFSEGLTLSGARRRLEESTPRTPAEERQEVAEVLDALTSDARIRIAHVRDGLRSLLQMLSGTPGTVVLVDVDAAGASAAKAAAGGRPAPPKPRLVESKGAVKPEPKMARVAAPSKDVRSKAAAKVVAKGKTKRFGM